MNPEPITLKSCPKAPGQTLDKAVQPQETIARVKEILRTSGMDILADSRRIDAGRLGIPVYLGICGTDAKAVMPVRKQMGKGASAAQAEASAIMELMERFAFFSFWQNLSDKDKLKWQDAKKRFGDSLISVEEILESVQDRLEPDKAEELLDLVTWQFYPATDLANNRIVWLPLDWFRMLGEFNGSSAGNTNEESLMQGVAELVERHVSCIASSQRKSLPTIDPQTCTDPVLHELLQKFSKCGIQLILKDMSLGMPLPTVGAIAWDPATFPAESEIVFTAGTATSPAKAAIRALTEIAQLGGDFCTNSCYEASGLPKFTKLDEFGWLLNGPSISLHSLPSMEHNDIYDELQGTIAKLLPTHVYAVETSHPELGIPAHYCIAPGMQFRERDKNQSLGLFIGRKLIEDEEPDVAEAGLKSLARIYGNAHFIPFFEGMLYLRKNDPEKAALTFEKAVNTQPDADARALTAFYAAHSWAQLQTWQKAIPNLQKALEYNADLKEAHNLLGVAWFKTGEYAKAEQAFDAALKIDKGSAIDLANRGMARKQLGNSTQAIADFESALILDPTLEFAKTNLAELRNTL